MTNETLYYKTLKQMWIPVH